MLNLTIKRINLDMKNYYKSDLQKNGIYCNFTEDNIFNVKILIIGPSDTPYENGFYFFDLVYPQNYPISSPKVTFMTTDSKFRSHPNLYSNGKVCLSILGTWSGPQWSAALSLNSVLLSIQSLFTKSPLQHEPGYDIKKNYKNKQLPHKYKNYDDIVNYANLYIATVKMLDSPLRGYEYFRPIIRNHFKKNISSYVMQLNYHKPNLSYPACVYGYGCVIQHNYIKKKFDDFYNDIEITDLDLDSSINKDKNNSDNKVNDHHINKNDDTKIKNKRKAPNIKAKDYDIGYEAISENDNKKYIVIQTKKGYKRWVKKTI